MAVNIKLILPGDRDLKIRCEDFARKNVKAIAILVDNDKRRSSQFFKEVLQACHMCGIIYGDHWFDDECPGPYGSNLSEGTFVKDKDLTEFSFSLFELMGGKL